MPKQNKKLYFEKLRQRWEESKKLAENDEVAKALHQELVATTGSKFSYRSFYFVLQNMKDKNLEGIPYVDCKTFNGWKQSGFIVKKGEKSKIDGITWISNKKEDDKDDKDKVEFIYPKVYKLFHRTQVEPVNK